MNIYNYKLILIFALCILLLVILYKLYVKTKNTYQIENFESVLNKLNKKKKNNNNSKNSNNSDNTNTKVRDNFGNDKISNTSKLIRKSISSLKSSKTNTTFDDLLKATENMDPDKYSVSNMQKDVADYIESFKKEKFSNNSKSTAESFEKFELYKSKFFEIFN